MTKPLHTLSARGFCDRCGYAQEFWLQHKCTPLPGREALSTNDASGLADTHAANSRPEIELEQLIKNGVFTVERDRGGDYMLGYLIERDVTYIKQLIAQEADKLANKRITVWEQHYYKLRRAIEVGRSCSHCGNCHQNITGDNVRNCPRCTIALDYFTTMYAGDAEIEAARRVFPHLEYLPYLPLAELKLDKGDSHDNN